MPYQIVVPNNIYGPRQKNHFVDEFIGRMKKGDTTLAVGGRVLNFVSLSDSFEESRNRIHQLLNNLNWSDCFFRKDIGYKVIKK